jgi:ribosomal protein L18
MKSTSRQEKRSQRKLRSKSVKGNLSRPRVVLFKSNRSLITQVINDEKGHTLLYLSTIDLEKNPGSPGEKKTSQCRKNKELAKKLGRVMADKLEEQAIKQIVFDRNGYPYHGKIEVFCNAIRERGIKF